MKTDLFNYDLPPELIAQHPAERRELARMLVLHRETGRIEHRQITDITDYLQAPDILVVNNTKVIPARIYGEKVTGGKVELLLLEETSAGEWKVLVRKGLGSLCRKHGSEIFRLYTPYSHKPRFFM